MVKLSNLSSCSRLFDSSVLRGILWSVAGIVSLWIFPAVIWLIYRMRFGSYKKSVYRVLLLLLLASNMYTCIYFFTILSIDQFSASYYSFFDETWRHHAVSSLLHTLSYALFQTTAFVCLLISSVRAIATVYPFKAKDISMWASLISVLMWFGFSTCLGYSGITWIFPEYKNSPESVLGLGLLLPAMGREERGVPLHMLAFIIPNATVLFFFCFSQGMLIHRLNESTRAISGASLIRRKKARRTSVLALLLVIIQYCPLLATHILAMFPVPLTANVAVIVTIWTLVVTPAGNVFLYVVFRSDFHRLFIRICCYFRTVTSDSRSDS